MRRFALVSGAAAAALMPAVARAETQTGEGADRVEVLECRAVLDALKVRYRPTRGRGIDEAVAIHHPISGVTYHTYQKDKPLVIDCSLAVSLALAAPYFAAQGITQVHYSSAHSRRFIRGTRRLSRHSFGLAIDINELAGPTVGSLAVRDDYEQGLGDNVDCVGRPLTSGGLILRRLACQLARSELFRIVLDPDYDADHYNHFHIEALRWEDRTDHDLLVERIDSLARSRK